jgi:hypothetical protein
MNSKICFALGLAALLPAQALWGADDGSLRIAVSVDVTAGTSFPVATPSNPVYYAPVVSGYIDRGAPLTFYQRDPPPVARVDNQLAKALADQGYRLAADPSAASIVLDFQWGYVAPYVISNGAANGGRGVAGATGFANGYAFSRPSRWQNGFRTRITNWDELGTYLIGEKWPDLAIEARRHEADPLTQEIFDSIRQTGPTNSGARYYLLISALDAPAYLQHKAVLLWRAHVSTAYWGHYIDEVLPTLIDTGVVMAGRDTKTPKLFTVQAAGWDPMDKTGGSQFTEYPLLPQDRKS